MDDAFGSACCSAGKQNIERVVEADTSEGLHWWCDSNGVIKMHRTGKGRQIRFCVQIGNYDNSQERGQASGQLGDNVAAVQCFAGIMIAITGKQKFWFDLAEPIVGTANAKIG